MRDLAAHGRPHPGPEKPVGEPLRVHNLLAGVQAMALGEGLACEPQEAVGAGWPVTSQHGVRVLQLCPSPPP